ncbi:MAG: transglutaminase-like domain-containing protein [Methylocella sp.]
MRETLAYMAQIVRDWRHLPEVTEPARSIIAGVPEKDTAGEIAALFSFVRDSVRYTMDTNGVERLQTPDYTLRVRQGDCDDKSILLAALLESVGIPARFVAVGFSPDYFEHVYVEALLDDGWVALDATENVPPGWAPPDPVTRINQAI